MGALLDADRSAPGTLLEKVSAIFEAAALSRLVVG
jgi:hypothetical protein